MGRQPNLVVNRRFSSPCGTAKANRARGMGTEAQKADHALDKIKAKIIEHYGQIKSREGFTTAEMVKNACQGIGNEYETLLSAFDSHNADFSRRVGKDRAKGTYQKYCIVCNHLEQFISSCYKRKDISMKELTEGLTRQFDIYLRTEIGLTSSGVSDKFYSPEHKQHFEAKDIQLKIEKNLTIRVSSVFLSTNRDIITKQE